MALDLPTTAPAALRELAARQAGVVRRADLVDVGMTRSAIDAQVAARRWRAYGPCVIVMHNGALTPAQRQWLALINAGPRAALAARTAAELGGLTGWSDDIVHVLVERGATPPAIPCVAVKVHESRRYVPERDLLPNRAPRRVRLERAVLDAATWTRSPRPACGIVVAAVQQRLSTPDRLRAELSQMGLVRHRRVLRLMLGDLAGGAEALNEIEFGRFCRRYGLPKPVRQVVRLDRNGRRRYLDATLVRQDGSVVAVEIDGAVHLVADTYWADCMRGNELVISGERLLRFPTIALYLHQDVVAGQLLRMIEVPEHRAA